MKIIVFWKRIFRNTSFRGKLLSILLIGIVPVIVGFTLLGNQLKEMVSYQNEYALKQNFQQVYNSVDNQMNNMVEVSTFLLSDESIHKVFQNNGTAISMVESMEQYLTVEDTRRIFVDSDSVDDIVFYLDSTFAMTGTSAGNSYRDIRIIMEQEWYKDMLSGKRSAYWGSLSCDEAIGSDRYFSYLHTIVDADDYKKMNGIVSINVEKSKLNAVMIPIYEEQFFLVQTEKELIFSTNDAFKEIIPVINVGSKEVLRIEDKEYLCISSKLADSEMILVTCIPEDFFGAQVVGSIYSFILILVFIVVIICAVYFILAERLSRRIIHLAEVCGKSEEGRLVKVKEDISQDEIGVLSRAYNSMIDRIDYLLKEQFRIGEEMKDAQLKALQAQINPHFLYNTLEMISWMVAKEDKKSAQGIIRSLTRYYKSVLNKGKDEIDILDEIQMSQAYMEIQSCRFKGKIRFQCEIDSSIGNLLVPKLILQPLLENAIFHGIVQKESGRGTIWLRMYRRDKNIVMEVSDDGVGFRYDSYMDETETVINQKLHPGSRYGLHNIKRRVVLFFEGESDVKVESTPGIGTSIYVIIPDKTEQ